jgi:O-antigen ligase
LHAGLYRGLTQGLIGGALALLALANAASASRTGALQWLVLAVLCGLPHWRSARALAWSAVGVYALAIVALPMLLEQITGLPQAGLITRLNESAGCESRRVLWANVLELIGQQPWLGWGWGELKFAHFIHPYGGERFCAILDNAHNLPLQLAVEWGLPLAVALCAALVWGVWRQQPWNETHPSRQAAWSVLAIIALHSLVEYPLWYGPFQMTVGLCVWLLWHHTAAAPQLPQTPQTAFAVVATGAVANGLRTVAALLTCVVLAYTAWDYTRVSQLYLPKAQRLAAYQEDTLAKVRGSRLFAHEVQFAELTTFTLTDDTAPRHYTLASQLLHFSPEPRVVQTLLESAQLLGVDNPLLRQIRQRFEVAYPHDFAQWASHAPP